mgnify:FL=1
MFSKSYVGSKVLGKFTSDNEIVYSKVVINVDDDISYEAGTETGSTLTVSIPFGTQKMADEMLERVKGKFYHPYNAETAIIDPAVEIGDAVEVNGVYGGVYKMSKNFDSLYSADISAPAKSEIGNEYPYYSSETREIVRQRKETRASVKILTDEIALEVSEREKQGKELTAELKVHSEQISARVTKTGGDSSSFGWDLLNDSWTIKANNTTVFKVTKSGAEVRGKITALSGKIGGFDIQSDYLSYNNQTWNGTNSQGIYIGVKGIQCGSKASGVQITPDGKLYAEDGYFRGSVSAGQIQYGYNPDDGEYNGYFNGEGLESRSVSGLEIKKSTVTTTNTNGGINASLGYADFANGVFNGWNTASMLSTEDKGLKIGGHTIAVASTSFRDGNGGTISLQYLTWI